MAKQKPKDSEIDVKRKSFDVFDWLVARVESCLRKLNFQSNISDLIVAGLIAGQSQMHESTLAKFIALSWPVIFFHPESAHCAHLQKYRESKLRKEKVSLEIQRS